MRFFTAQTPQLRIFVRNKYLGLTDSGMTEAYLLSVTSIPSRPLFFNVHLETGAIWNRLPITALLCDRFRSKITTPVYELPMKTAQPWSCLPGDIQAYEITSLKNYEVKARTNDRRTLDGHYLFTVDVAGDGLAEDSLQFKTHNICVLSEGNLIAYPNNNLLFLDKHFTVENGVPNYKRQDQYLLAD